MDQQLEVKEQLSPVRAPVAKLFVVFREVLGVGCRWGARENPFPTGVAVLIRQSEERRHVHALR